MVGDASNLVSDMPVVVVEEVASITGGRRVEKEHWRFQKIWEMVAHGETVSCACSSLGIRGMSQCVEVLALGQANQN